VYLLKQNILNQASYRSHSISEPGPAMLDAMRLAEGVPVQGYRFWMDMSYYYSATFLKFQGLC